MPDQLQLRGGTTTEHNSFTGALREVTVDTTKKTLVVHDGSQAGGTPLMKESGATAASSVQIGTGGIERFKITSSEVVFNETSTDTDFRIEGNGEANLFKVDAGNDRIGIGVASPVSDIHTVSSSDHIITHQSTTSGADIRMNFRDSGNNDQGGLHYLFNGQSMKFITGTSAMIILNNGGATGQEAGIEWRYENITTPRAKIHVNSSDQILRFSTANNEAMRIDASQRVGIGTSSPAYILDVVGDGGGSFSASTNSTQGQLSIVGKNSSGGVSAISRIKSYPDGSSNQSHLAFETRNSSSAMVEAMRINSSGNVGIGTASPQRTLHLSSNSTVFALTDNLASTDQKTKYILSDAGILAFGKLNDAFDTATEQLRIDNSGNIGIGTSSPSRLLHLQKSSDFGIRITKLGSSDAEIKNTNSLDLCCSSGGSAGQIIRMLTGANTTSLNEVMRIDGGQKVAIGTTTTTEKLIVAGAIDFTGAATGNTANSGKLSYESATAFFNSKGPDTSTRGKIGLNIAASDGSLGYTALKVQTGGQVTFGNNDTDPWNNTGNNPSTIINATQVRGGLMSSSAFNGDVMALNRMGSDGAIIIFYGQGNPEGSIDVNGSTISLTGGHLTRWTKIPSISDTDKSKRPTIYRGSVLTNLDAMCEWKRVEYTNSDNITKTKPYSGSEDVGSTVEYTDDKGDKYSAKVVLELNEQLNKMEVSSVEGDPNVAGVFQGWDDNDDVIVNDLYCAMTGDFVIRIAKGVTVKRGDLLMSAGDGTAKPQDDDIIRSKTVAKVTSTTVSTTYDDGSFCVPCVLMAC